MLREDTKGGDIDPLYPDAHDTDRADWFSMQPDQEKASLRLFDFFFDPCMLVGERIVKRLGSNVGDQTGFSVLGLMKLEPSVTRSRLSKMCVRKDQTEIDPF